MTVIPLTRCQFLMPFAEIHSAIGGPTSALLAKFRLPTSLEEKADHYVPLLPAVHFATAAQEKQGLSEIAFRASQLLTFDHLSEALRARIRHSPTLLVALQQMCKWAPIEDTNLHLWLESNGQSMKICSRLIGTEGIAHLEMSQWLQNIFVIHIVRQFAGANWTPKVIAFEATYTPGIDVQSYWTNTRFLSGQKASWIDVPLELVSLPNPANALLPMPPQNGPQPFGKDFISVLELSLPAYLDEGGPTIMQAAEMIGLSVRSLQRKLSLAGITYSGLLEQARFNNAIRLLSDTENKIIDIAFSSGYADPAHFTRAFRRISGCTPREFRKRWRNGAGEPRSFSFPIQGLAQYIATRLHGRNQMLACQSRSTLGHSRENRNLESRATNSAVMNGPPSNRCCRTGRAAFRVQMAQRILNGISNEPERFEGA